MITVDDMLARIPGPPNLTLPQGARSAVAYADAHIELRLFHPGDPDRQQPHERAESYVVVAGRGECVIEHAASRGTERLPCTPHDVLFVPAQVPHGVDNFTPDFTGWVDFHGPSHFAKGTQ
ncbi:MAG: cupin domain-containing protein [Burkholderiaceae bacterium]|nr:cupin domain-containing protein [Burkholderiaceae bacterium]